MNETNLLKTIEYLWDNPKSFSITVVGFVLSLTTVAGQKPNQTKIKMNDSKVKIVVLYIVECSCQNDKYKHRTDTKADKSRWYKTIGFYIRNSIFKTANKSS